MHLASQVPRQAAEPGQLLARATSASAALTSLASRESPGDDAVAVACKGQALAGGPALQKMCRLQNTGSRHAAVGVCQEPGTKSSRGPAIDPTCLSTPPRRAVQSMP